jgi:cytidine deaminase
MDAGGKRVFAQAGPVEAVSTHRCCAERNVLARWIGRAVRHGVRPHRVVAWVRRKSGGDVVIWRGPGRCSVPCILCRRVLEKFDMRVTCTLPDGRAFAGRLWDVPPSKLTSRQVRFFCAP